MWNLQYVRRLVSEYKNNSVQKAAWSFKGNMQEMLICLFFLKPVSRLFIYLFIFLYFLRAWKQIFDFFLSYDSLRYNEREAYCIFVLTLLNGEEGADKVCQKLGGRFCEGRRIFFFFISSFKEYLIWPDRLIWNLLPLFRYIFTFAIFFPHFVHRKIFIDVLFKCYYLWPFIGERNLTGCLA